MNKISLNWKTKKIDEHKMSAGFCFMFCLVMVGGGNDCS